MMYFTYYILSDIIDVIYGSIVMIYTNQCLTDRDMV